MPRSPAVALGSRRRIGATRGTGQGSRPGFNDAALAMPPSHDGESSRGHAWNHQAIGMTTYQMPALISALGGPLAGACCRCSPANVGHSLCVQLVTPHIPLRRTPSSYTYEVCTLSAGQHRRGHACSRETQPQCTDGGLGLDATGGAIQQGAASLVAAPVARSIEHLVPCCSHSPLDASGPSPCTFGRAANAGVGCNKSAFSTPCHPAIRNTAPQA